MQYAHRGVHFGSHNENTASAFRRATRLLGYEGFECDVRLTKDNVPVALHDETLERTHNDARRIDDICSSELNALGIPRIAEVVAIATRNFATVIFDLKVAAQQSVDMIDAMYGAENGGRIYLVWTNTPLKTPAQQYFACDYVFGAPVDGIDGIAAKFDATHENMASIDLLPRRFHLNLYALDCRHLQKMIETASSRPNTSVTL